MTHRPADLWNAIRLASTAGLVERRGSEWTSRLDFVPLFETTYEQVLKKLDAFAES